MSSPRHSLTLGRVQTTQDKDESVRNSFSGTSPSDAVRGVADMCRQRCVYHEHQAGIMRIVEYSLQIPMLLVAGVTTVIATIIPVANLYTVETQILLAVVSAISTALASILRLYNPGVRREEHQSCERMYRSLARDMSVRLLTFDSDSKDMTRDDYFKIVLRDCQRALDYIQGIEVAL